MPSYKTKTRKTRAYRKPGRNKIGSAQAPAWIAAANRERQRLSNIALAQEWLKGKEVGPRETKQPTNPFTTSGKEIDASG